jgi:hypothetical protein
VRPQLPRAGGEEGKGRASKFEQTGDVDTGDERGYERLLEVDRVLHVVL